LLTAQLVTLSALPEDQQEIKNVDPQSQEESKLNKDFASFARTATEEISRR